MVEKQKEFNSVPVAEKPRGILMHDAVLQKGVLVWAPE